MKTIGYTRVSTTEQAREGFSLEMQARKIAAYCDVQDWTLGEMIEDEGESAKSLKRPGMQRLLAMVKAKEVETVIVYKLDRLTRSVADLGVLVTLFERYGVSLVSMREALDATTATGRLMMNVIASISQWEREVTGERTRDTLQHLKAEGKPYCRPVIRDAEILPRIKAMQAAGLGLRAIARALNGLGIQTARGGEWYASTVRQILGRVA